MTPLESYTRFVPTFEQTRWVRSWRILWAQLDAGIYALRTRRRVISHYSDFTLGPLVVKRHYTLIWVEGTGRVFYQYGLTRTEASEFIAWCEEARGRAFSSTQTSRF